MPTLYDVFYNTEKEDLGDPIKNTFDEYFKTPDFTVDTSVPDYTKYDLKTEVESRETRNAAIDALGQGLWSFLDEAAFGVPGLIAPKDIEEDYLTPETIPGKVSAAIGGTAGFVMGAPMKVGAKVTSMIAKPFIKKAGSETVQQVIKKTDTLIDRYAKATAGKKGDIFVDGGQKATRKILNDQVKKRLIGTVHQSRWDNAAGSVSKNWGSSSIKAVTEVVKNNIITGEITPQQGALLIKSFKKNIGTKPMQDFVDLIMRRHPNKFGFVLGSVVQEGVMFGLIDAAMEVSHSMNEEGISHYDWTAPLWGVGVGSAFGMLKLLPAAGKSSITSEDFKSGVKSLFSKNYYKKMDEDQLVHHAELLGKTMELNGIEPLIKFGGKNGLTINLSNSLSSIMAATKKNGTYNREQAKEILREALNSQRKYYGQQMMKEAVKEDFKSSLANWPRILLGTAIMNTRTVLDISRGAEMPAEDLATSLMIGAFINRKGRPSVPDMNMKKMVELRRGLHATGTPQTRIYDIYPTLGEDQVNAINPLTDVSFKKLREKASELNIVSSSSESTEVTNKDGSPSMIAGGKSFPYFDEFYRYLSGASGKLYIKPKALITEKEAIQIESMIKETVFNGKEAKSIDDFKEILQSSTDKVTDNIEYELARTLYDDINRSTNGKTILNNPDQGHLGTMPEMLIINQKLIESIERGEISNLDYNAAHKALQKVNKLLNINSNIMKGQTTSNPDKRIVELETPEQVRTLMKEISNGESRLNKTYEMLKPGLKFDFNNLDYLSPQLMVRMARKSIDKISNFFDDVRNPNFNEFRNILNELEILVPNQKDVSKFDLRLFSNMEVVYPEGAEYKDGNYEALLKSTIGILGAKGNKSIVIDTNAGSNNKIQIPAEKMKRLSEYFMQNKISTQKELLEMFTADITQKIHTDLIKGSKVTAEDLSILSSLSGLETPFANFSTMSDGGAGWTVRKIELNESMPRTMYNMAESYNRRIDKILENATNNKGKKFIVEDRPFRVNDNMDVLALNTIINRSNAKQYKSAQDTLIDFVKTLDAADPLKQGISKWIESAERPDDLLFHMINKGLITTDAKTKGLRYVLNKEIFNEKTGQLKEENRNILSDYLKKFGVHTDDIQKMITTAEHEIDQVIEQKFKGHSGTLSQQGFFERYFPAATGGGSKFQTATEQNDIINKSLYDSNNNMRKSPHNELISKMEFKIGDTVVSGKDVVNKLQYQKEYNRALNDVQKILILRHGTVSKDVISVTQGKASVKVKNHQRTPLTNLLEKYEIPFVYVDGESYHHFFQGGKVKTTSVNVFDFNSTVAGDGYLNPEIIRASKDAFRKAVDNYAWSGNDSGIAIIRLGNAKNPIAVPKTQFKKVAEMYMKEIYNKYYKEDMVDVFKDRLTKMKEGLDGHTAWGEIHVDAMRSLIVNDMVSSKGNQTKFLETLTMSSNELADLGKRLSLFHTPSFRRVDNQLLERLNSARPDLRNTLNKFVGRDLGYVVWNDKNAANTVKDRNAKYLKAKNISWEKMLGSRENESGFDSISFISKDYTDFLNAYYGTVGATIFKPIISSNGKNDMMYAKTVFVYDPDIQSTIFSKQERLDILLTRSADKMKSSMSRDAWESNNRPDRPLQIDKTVDEMNRITTAEINNHMRFLPKETVGVSLIPELEMRARQSYSIPNYMNTVESAEYYNTFYKERLDRVLGVRNSSDGLMGKLMKDALYKRIALLKLKNYDPNVTIEEMQNSPEGYAALGHHLQVAAMGGDPRMLGENVLINTVKSQFLDPILSPESAMKGESYGGKSVLKQTFKFRDLEPTIRTGEKENTKIYQGEIMLPNYAYEGKINFGDKDLELRILDNKGNVREMKEGLKRLEKERNSKSKNPLSKKEFEKYFENLIKDTFDGDLGTLHDYIKQFYPSHSIGVMVTRYPRTTPNDLAILRVKGFLDKKHGNATIVNDFDVLNIFEGDYDVDEVDFFWAMNKGTWNHNKRVQRHWVNTVNPEYYKGSVPELSISNGGMHNDGWNTFDSNNRMLSKGIGLVQKTVRLVNHMASLGKKNDKGQYDLMEYNGNKIVVDYDNASFFDRTALESQLIIDYWKGVSPDIVNNITNWRSQFLFPTIEASKGKEQVPSFIENQSAHYIEGPSKNRIRIFRKYDKNGTEIDLSDIDRIMLQSLMSEHGKLLTLGTEVYDNAGLSRNPEYHDIMSVTGKYVNHLNDMTTTLYRAVKSKMGHTDEVTSIFGREMKVRSKSQRQKKWLKDDALKDYEMRLSNEMQNPSLSGELTYQWWGKSPLLPGVLQTGRNIAMSGGSEGSVIERIYREIYHRDPLGVDGRSYKSEMIPQKDLYAEMQVAADQILSGADIGKGSTYERIRDIIPEMTGKINSDVKIIKFWKRQISNLIRNNNIPEKLKQARIDGLKKVIKEKEQVLKDYLPEKYLTTGQSKYLEPIKMVDISRESDVIEGTVQWYTLWEYQNKFGVGNKSKDFYTDLTEMKKIGFEEYNEMIAAGRSTEFGKKTINNDKRISQKLEVKDNAQEVESYLKERLEEYYNKYKLPFLIEYAMPNVSEASIGVFNGNPMAISSKPSGRFKRVIKFLLDKMNTTSDPIERQEMKEILEVLTKRYSAYRNFFDNRTDLIPLGEQDVMGTLNNVPGFSKRLTGTFDRYESIGIEKGIFNRNIFGMGPEYDTHMAFYRNLMTEAFGKKSEFGKLENVLSYTNQLMMENNYLDPVSYYSMQEGIKIQMEKLGLGDALKDLSGSNRPYSLSPEGMLLGSKNDGVSIKPLGLLSDYRLSMLRRFIKQGRDIKDNQKSSENWKEFKENYEKSNPYCNPG